MYNSKFIKNNRGKNRGFSFKGDYLVFGDYGLKSTSWCTINSNQIESGRKVISKNIKKLGNLWIRIFPDRSYTKKPVDVRMGKGKGDVHSYVFYLKPGRIIYEIKGLSKSASLKVLKLASYKLPAKTSFIFK
ncbi:MAG: 50S ribosomal protein L16 [Candidatus Nasuia deltocephalinicola]